MMLGELSKTISKIFLQIKKIFSAPEIPQWLAAIGTVSVAIVALGPYLDNMINKPNIELIYSSENEPWLVKKYYNPPHGSAKQNGYQIGTYTLEFKNTGRATIKNAVVRLDRIYFIRPRQYSSEEIINLRKMAMRWNNLKPAEKVDFFPGTSHFLPFLKYAMHYTLERDEKSLALIKKNKTITWKLLSGVDRGFDVRKIKPDVDPDSSFWIALELVSDNYPVQKFVIYCDWVNDTHLDIDSIEIRASKVKENAVYYIEPTSEDWFDEIRELSLLNSKY